MLKQLAENNRDDNEKGSGSAGDGGVCVAEAIDVEQLQLIQLCFGEHEFGVILDNYAAEGDEEKPLVNGDGELDNAEEECLQKSQKSTDVAFDFDPVFFVRDKLDYGVPLVSLCRDLETYATYLNNCILRHVNVDVHGAFVKVSGHLIGIQDELRYVKQPVNDAVKKTELALEKLSQLEEAVRSQINEASEVEMARLFDVSFLKLLLLYNLFSERIDELPFCLRPAKGIQQQQKQMVTHAKRFHFQDTIAAAARSAHVYDLLCDIASIFRQMKCLYNSLPQFLQRTKEYEEASAFLSDGAQISYSVFSTVYVALYEEYMRTSCDTLKKCLIDIMSLYRTAGGVREFCQMYRECILRPLLESVLSWRAATQARHSLQETISLLTTLQKQLEDNIHCFLPLLREAFGKNVWPIPMIIWPAVCEALVKKMLSLYDISVPTAFQKRYLAAHKLLALMEKMCASKDELCALQQSPDVALWKHRWNTDVYGTMQTNELSKRVTNAIQNATATLFKHLASQQGQMQQEEVAFFTKEFKIGAFAMLKEALDWLLSDDTYIQPVTPTFMKAAARETYRMLRSMVTHVEAEISGKSMQDWLDVVVSVIVDINTLAEYIEGEFRTRLEEASGQTFAVTSPFIKLFAEETCRGFAAHLKNLVQTRVTEESLVVLQNIRLVRSAYAHMQKPFPTAPSWFIPHIVEPLQRFNLTIGSVFSAETHRVMMASLVEDLAMHFCSLAKETLVAAKKTEDSWEKLRRRRETTAAGGRGQSADRTYAGTVSPFSPTTTTSSPTIVSTTTTVIGARPPQETASDSDKMTVQLYLDAKAFVEGVGNMLNGCVNVEELPKVVALFRLLRRAKWILGEEIPESLDVDEFVA